jgi:hypothetical protein
MCPGPHVKIAVWEIAHHTDITTAISSWAVTHRHRTRLSHTGTDRQAGTGTGTGYHTQAQTGTCTGTGTDRHMNRHRHRQAHTGTDGYLCVFTISTRECWKSPGDLSLQPCGAASLYL